MDDFSVLGDNLKSTRKKMGLSLDKVSAMTGVSKTMLSQIERSESMPTIATVWKIANGLKIKLETLLENSTSEVDVQNIEDMIPVMDDDGKMIIHSIFPFSPTSGYEVFHGTFKPGCNYSKSNHTNSTTEQIFVNQGVLELVVSGQSYVLKAGSSITFDSMQEHRYINPGNEDAKVVIIVNY